MLGLWSLVVVFPNCVISSLFDPCKWAWPVEAPNLGFQLDSLRSVVNHFGMLFAINMSMCLQFNENFEISWSVGKGMAPQGLLIFKLIMDANSGWPLSLGLDQSIPGFHQCV